MIDGRPACKCGLHEQPAQRGATQASSAACGRGWFEPDRWTSRASSRCGGRGPDGRPWAPSCRAWRGRGRGSGHGHGRIRGARGSHQAGDHRRPGVELDRTDGRAGATAGQRSAATPSAGAASGPDQLIVLPPPGPGGAARRHRAQHRGRAGRPGAARRRARRRIWREGRLYALLGLLHLDVLEDASTAQRHLASAGPQHPVAPRLRVALAVSSGDAATVAALEDELARGQTALGGLRRPQPLVQLPIARDLAEAWLWRFADGARAAASIQRALRIAPSGPRDPELMSLALAVAGDHAGLVEHLLKPPPAGATTAAGTCRSTVSSRRRTSSATA